MIKRAIFITLTVLLALILNGCSGVSNNAPQLPPSQVPRTLSSGQIVYEIPDTMAVNVRSEIRLRIARLIQDEIFREGLGENVDQYSIQVSDIMEVQLNDESGAEDCFKISEISEREQLLLHQDFTEWAWYVTPLKAGNCLLNIKVNAIIPIEGTDRKKSVIVLEKEVKIIAIKGEFFSNKIWAFSDILMFVSLIGIFVFIVYKRIAQKETIELSISELKKMIAKDDSEIVIKKLYSIFSNLKNQKALKEVIMLSASLNQLNSEQNMNIITHEDSQIKKSKINYALINIIERYLENETETNEA
ncbi:hypothetical protein [Haliscomenobacter sp.]|uniref:hypothetical protein n=1 Tax=Haliscomenobacter sp. TaxID=2717303 RepID=UPI003BAB2213